jgi:UDP-glucose 6-dehydrogenase
VIKKGRAVFSEERLSVGGYLYSFGEKKISQFLHKLPRWFIRRKILTEEKESMHVGVLGINYKSSELNVRETLAKAAMGQITDHIWNDHQFSYVLLSTCNRTEIYFSAEDLTAAHTQLIHLLRSGVRFSL